MSQKNHNAEEFLAVASQYKLGELPTEQPHPLTNNLSSLSKHDVLKALRLLHKIDAHAVQSLLDYLPEIHLLRGRIAQTLATGHTVFLCGCGATGRLSLTLETLWREKYAGTTEVDRVVSFMAGGDVALIKSIERFEDFPEYGKRQLMENGFCDGDLLIGSSEGGETPFVIGAVEQAALVSSNKPFFLYCNPDEILCTVAERSKLVIENSAIEKICLFIGPMALSGSTRMQASTVLMALIGECLLHFDQNEDTEQRISTIIDFWAKCDISFLEDFIQKESRYYADKEYVLYETDMHFGITILTDTTERSPTFSLVPYENILDTPLQLSLSYLYFPFARDSMDGWEKLLRRPPRPLAWPEMHGIASIERLQGFDFSKNLKARREAVASPGKHHHFLIQSSEQGILFSLGDFAYTLSIKGLQPLQQHLVLKMILNMHSTLVMGRLGRYERNIMTWVRPSNNKLVDRTIRYVDFLLQEKGVTKSYKEIAHACFSLMESLSVSESLVLAAVQYFDKSINSGNL